MGKGNNCPICNKPLDTSIGDNRCNARKNYDGHFYNRSNTFNQQRCSFMLNGLHWDILVQPHNKEVSVWLSILPNGHPYGKRNLEDQIGPELYANKPKNKIMSVFDFTDIHSVVEIVRKWDYYIPDYDE